MEEQAPKRKAKDNPWYRLATLNGEPSSRDDEVAAKNRVVWNRWMASRLSEGFKATLLEKGWTSEELTPFTGDELRDIETSTGLLMSENDDYYVMDFSNTEFEASFFAFRFIFPFITFDRSAFVERTSFENAIFTDHAAFENATFPGGVKFASATFAGAARFERTTFTADARFERATFASGVSFENATFAMGAHFESATFTGYIYFESATFTGYVHFERATFTGPLPAYFRSATFTGLANFGSAIFAAGAHFERATFTDRATFINAEMKDVTAFDDVTFAWPPQCFNTKLHEGTIWHGVRWPAPPRDAARARQFVNAYERLKLEMDKLKKHGDELDFFALEQQCRRVVLGRWKGSPIAIYGFLSDYGRSYARPLLLLSIAVVLGVVPLRAHFGGGWSFAAFTDHSFTGAGLLLSFANTLSALGIRKELIDAGLLQGLPVWLKAVATI